MPSYRYHKCRDCKRSSDDVHVSTRGLCPDCAHRRWKSAATQQANHDGPVFDKWQANWLAGGGNAGRPVTPWHTEP